jgi:transposase/uncharacterized protein (DUF427 family)
MLTVDDFGQIRRAFRDGMSIHQIARTFRHSRAKIRQVLVNAQPKRYTRSKPPAAPILGPFHAVIDAILVADELAPPKQRHTAMQIFRRLGAEHGFRGGYDQVRRYVGRRQRDRRETFIPLAHDPGQRLEADFGHIYVDFPAGRRLVPVLIAAWSYSDYGFALALPTERTEAILTGMIEAFAFFGCVAHEVWWDNPKTVVAQIFTGRDRRPNAYYAALASHYTFEPLFCMPARGNEKPYAETRVRVLQRQWATPVPQVPDFAALNRHLRERCLGEVERTVQGRDETIGQRFARDRAAALPLPVHPFDACITKPAQVDKYQTVRFDTNRYSVPRSCAFRNVTVKGYVERVEIVAGGQVVARHARGYGRDEQLLDPLHYLEALDRRPAALDHAPVLRDWALPACFTRLREELETRYGRQAGARQYIRILQLLSDHPLSRVEQAVEESLAQPPPDAERIRLRVAFHATTATAAAGAAPATSLHQYDVPLPDLNRFDQLLSDGDQSDDDSCEHSPVA